MIAQIPIAYCLLPIAYCLLPIAYCLLPIPCSLQGVPHSTENCYIFFYQLQINYQNLQLFLNIK
jgi:hypothetical protein